MGFFARLKEKLSRFMTGRYGSDNLSRFVLGAALIMFVLELILTSIFSKIGINDAIAVVIIEMVLYYGALILLIWNIFRTFSRNVQKRYNENIKFLRFKARVKDFFKGNKSSTKGGTCKVFRCPGCKQKVRVPKGKGRIAITCPKCKTQFIKKT